METSGKSLTVSTIVNAPLQTVWDCWTQNDHIRQWYTASDDWHAPHAESELRTGGRFKIGMAAKDGSTGFDFEGTFEEIVEKEAINFVLDDGRKVSIRFAEKGSRVKVTEIFEAEDQHSTELQQQGWQAILDSFKRHVESQAASSPAESA